MLIWSNLYPKQARTPSVRVLYLAYQHASKSPHTQQYSHLHACMTLSLSLCISCRWWCIWKDYSGYGSTALHTAAGTHRRPGDISNSKLLADPETGRLLDNLAEGEDFVIVTAGSWQKLYSWYGGGPVIQRTATLEGLAPHNKRPRVTLYPLKLEACYAGQHKWIEVEQTVSVMCSCSRGSNLSSRSGCCSPDTTVHLVDVWWTDV